MSWETLFCSSSYRIGPVEVESALAEHPAVVESAVVGSPDPIRGEVIVPPRTPPPVSVLICTQQSQLQGPSPCISYLAPGTPESESHPETHTHTHSSRSSTDLTYLET